MKRTAILAFFGLIALAAVGIPLNALYFQDGRHPAPLFRSSARAPESAGGQRIRPDPGQLPLPPARPAAIAPVPAPQPSKGLAAKPEAPVQSEKQRDAIGALLEGGAPKKVGGDQKVLAAQRALIKLGYPLRADGVLGAGTRQTIEKFERATGLPPKGELTPKIMRQLQTRSGITIE